MLALQQLRGHPLLQYNRVLDEAPMLSLITDFEGFTKFKPDPRHEPEVHTMLDQLIAWGRGMKAVRVERPEARP